MVIPNLPPWAIKLLASAAILAVAFTAGCRVQKQMDAAKILRIQNNYDRCVGIVDQAQDNIDTLEAALEAQNAAVIALGEEGARREADLIRSHERTVQRLRRAHQDTLRDMDAETERLRARLEGLSVAEACVESMKEIVR